MVCPYFTFLAGLVHKERRSAVARGSARSAWRLGTAEAEWLAAFKGGPAPKGNFLNVVNCSEAIALAMAAIRYSRKVFVPEQCAPAPLWDEEKMESTNITNVNQCLTHEYREAWTLMS